MSQFTKYTIHIYRYYTIHIFCTVPSKRWRRGGKGTVYIANIAISTHLALEV